MFVSICAYQSSETGTNVELSFTVAVVVVVDNSGECLLLVANGLLLSPRYSPHLRSFPLLHRKCGEYIIYIPFSFPFPFGGLAKSSNISSS